MEGQNLLIAFRTGEGKAGGPALVAELVDLHVDVLLVMGSEATLRAARDATRFPIVMVAIAFDPMARGATLRDCTARREHHGAVLPATRVDGQTPRVPQGRLPQLARVAVFWDAFSADQLPAAEAAARGLGVHLQPVELRNPPYDYASAFRTVAEGMRKRSCP